MEKTETPAALSQVSAWGPRWAFCVSGWGWEGQLSPGPVAYSPCQRRRVRWKTLIWWSRCVSASRGRQVLSWKQMGKYTGQSRAGLLWLRMLHALLQAATQPHACPFLRLESQSSLIMTCWPSLLSLGMLLVFLHKSFSPSGKIISPSITTWATVSTKLDQVVGWAKNTT